jgi:hypothetical protein
VGNWKSGWGNRYSRLGVRGPTSRMEMSLSPRLGAAEPPVYGRLIGQSDVCSLSFVLLVIESTSESEGRARKSPRRCVTHHERAPQAARPGEPSGSAA